MTDRHSGNERAPRDISEHFSWLNVSGETIPAYGVVKIILYDSANKWYSVTKPDGAGDLYFVNGPIPVVTGRQGRSSLWNKPRLGLVEAGLGLGDTCGPIDNSWVMSSEGTGWVLFSDPISGVAALVKEGSGAEGGAINLYHGITVRCISQGWYIVELKDELGLMPPSDVDLSGEGGGCEGEEEGCDLCDLLYAGDLYECGDAAPFDPQRPELTGNGTFVFAYDKRTVPLKPGGQVTLRRLSERTAPEPSDSGLSDDAGSFLYEVLTGEYKMVSIPHEDWECCNGEFVKKISCVTFLVEGEMCETTPDPCPSE